MTWTPERIAQLKALKATGDLSHAKIARIMGLTVNQVCGRVTRMSGKKREYRYQQKPAKSRTTGDWDGKLFEPWTEYRARRQAERAQMQA